MPAFIQLSTKVRFKKRFISIIKIYTFLKQHHQSMIKLSNINKMLDDAACYCVCKIRYKRNNALEIIIDLIPLG